MDYKDSLNLPQTGFPMRADLVKREPERLRLWEQNQLYAKIQSARAEAPSYLLHDGPPFANGDVHIGTAGNKILKDLVLKSKTLSGYRAPYVPGWDCHGLPIEFKVSQEMRKKGDADTSPAVIRRACEAYAKKYIDLQRTQFKRLGVLGNWDNPYLTLNKEYEAEELGLFADLVERGFVYRGKKPVYWSIPCQTALAEAEVEYKDHVSPSVYVRFPVVGHPGLSVLIWTTTPWTLPANLAVAYNSSFSYSLCRSGDEAFIVSAMLLPTVAKICGWEGYEIVRSLDGAQIAQLELQHPFCARTAKLHPGDSFVENTTGTGFVHIAPGHGMDDYHLGLQHGLPIYSPVDDNGCLQPTEDLPIEQQMPAELIGKSILDKGKGSEANAAVIALLEGNQMLVQREDFTHSYPHCWRSKTPVIFRAMDQWFIRVDHEIEARCPNLNETQPSPVEKMAFRKIALDEINRVQWIPEWGRNRFEGAVEVRPDWCISRQRTWGLPIPAFYDAAGDPILDAQIVRNTAALVAEHGSQIWFEKTAEELWPLVKPDDWAGAAPSRKSTDTLDVWIDSGSSSRCVIMQRPELRQTTGNGQSSTSPAWQADMYFEGSDQHRGWFQSSLLLSLAGNGSAPYRTVLTHGFMVDEDRQKISKSNQSAYQKPQTADVFVQKYGADVLRLWVASQDFRDQIMVSEERIRKVGETYRMIRNTLRYQLSNLYDFDPEQHSVADEALTGLDRWILDQFGRLHEEVLGAYEAFEFHVVYQRISQFIAVELSAIYHDIVKDRLYTDPADSARRRSTQTALHRLVIGLAQLLSPILSFTADEAWEFIPGRPTESVHLSYFNRQTLKQSDEERAQWKRLFETRELALPVLEQARQAKSIGKALEAKLQITGPAETLTMLEPHREVFRELLNVSQLAFAGGDPDLPLSFQVSRADGEKCGRCWHWETDVGSHPEHPLLCGRCVTAVTEKC